MTAAEREAAADPCLGCGRRLTFEPHVLGVAASCPSCKTKRKSKPQPSPGPTEMDAAEGWNAQLTKPLRWEYCECGCHCLVARGTSYHLYWNLKRTYTLWEGGYLRLNSAKFPSSEAAEKEAQRRHAKAKLREKQELGEFE